MTTHLTARIAWHDDGWNGRVCERPENNSYCVGLKSYPGDVIRRERDLPREKTCAGKAVCDLAGEDLPPCVYSINAFGSDTITGYSNPPDFFFDGAEREEWDIPPATVCVWPYEAMYGDEVYSSGYLDNDKRKQGADEFFAELQDNESLIFYYANHSNPFTEEDAPRYAIAGVSRVREIGAPLVYRNPDERIIERFAGGMIWARNVTSHYPDEGLRIPYHKYRDQPDILNRIAVFPENPGTCKYGARHVSDDGAIGLLEQLLDVVATLKEIGDDSEDWASREKWLLSQIARLWQRRGLYPGLLTVMSHLGAETAIQPAKSLCDKNREKDAFELFYNALDNRTECPELELTGTSWLRVARSWQLLDDDVQSFLRVVAPRVDLSPEQLEQITGDKRAIHNLPDTLNEIVENPFALSELFLGEAPDDFLPWSTIDRGVFPSPELGGETLSDMLIDDPRRLRALCVEQLKREPNQTFRSAKSILEEVNARLDRLPEWKRCTFREKYFEVDRDILEEAMVLRKEDEVLYLYLLNVHEDERLVDKVLTELVTRPPITLKRPVPSNYWLDEISEPDCDLAKNARQEYQEAVKAQADVCNQIFRCPISVISGPAGTGKTTVVKSLVSGIRRVDGEGAPVHIMTPTGKATDRVRAVFGKSRAGGTSVSTIHSFLASNGWLNENLTFKRFGGQRAELNGTLIVDETSMLDLALAATFFRAVEWQGIQRLILVGDHNQLPPIGRGRVFTDIIEWMREDYPDNLAVLEENLRQLENKVSDNGTGILELAELFKVDARVQETQTTPEQEQLLARIHEEGEIDKDLKVVFWNDADELHKILRQSVETSIRENSDKDVDVEVWQIWQDEVYNNRPERIQILSPHRGELHGIEATNLDLQSFLTNDLMKRVGAIDGITLNDKVIQYRNRPKSRPIWAYNFGSKKAEQVEIFNGEIGFVNLHNFDRKYSKSIYFGKGRIEKFQVKFARKSKLCVNYGRKLPTAQRGRYTSEKVEENLELAYAISIHKSQGSEFENTFIVIPDGKNRPISPELLYTALTRATKHCTLLVERDVSPVLAARRKENSQNRLVSSSLLDRFNPIDERLLLREGWYEAGKIHEALTGDMVRSKSEVIIANLLHQHKVPFTYEEPCSAPDGTFYLPDFTIRTRGKTIYWEHWGRMDNDSYKAHRDKKVQWYATHFPDQLVETFEGSTLSNDALEVIQKWL